MVITNFPKSGAALLKMIFFQFPLSEWFFIIRYVKESRDFLDKQLTPRSVICLIATLLITARVRSEFIETWMIIVFSILYPFYLVLAATIGLYGHARAVTKYSAWNPTART
jgi:hypothetical protein